MTTFVAQRPCVSTIALIRMLGQQRFREDAQSSQVVYPRPAQEEIARARSLRFAADPR